jgi:hypothetical protein
MLWAFAQEVLCVYYMVEERPIVDCVPSVFAEAKYRMLLSWAVTLDNNFKRDIHASSDLMIFQQVHKPNYYLSLR